MDRFDRAILSILQRNCVTPQREIGEAVGLSAPAVQRRIKRLQERGVIEATIAVLNPTKVGQTVTLLVQVTIESERLDLIDAMKRSFLATSEVQQCYYVTGEVDFVLVITVTTMADYEALTRRLFFENANVKRFHTLVAMERVKVGLSVPIPPEHS